MVRKEMSPEHADVMLCLDTDARSYSVTDSFANAKGEFDFETYEEAMPELHKACKIEDELGRVWYPKTINIAEKGTVFLNGTSREDCYYSGIKTIPLTKEEKKMPRFKGQTHKSDPSTLQNFGIGGFFDACDYIGLFELEE